MGFFGLASFVALKAEESSRMVQHAHGFICSRFFKLYNITGFIEEGSKLVMNLMDYVATNVMATRLVCNLITNHAY
jgi:hypothetical protein